MPPSHSKRTVLPSLPSEVYPGLRDKNPVGLVDPSLLRASAFHEWEEQGLTLRWYATGEVAAQLLTEAVSLRNLAQKIRINASGKFLTSALATM